MGRMARGVKGMELAEGDEVVGMEVMRPQDTILTVTQRGYGKRTPADAYPRHHRGGQGVKGLQITAKNGPVLGLLQLNPEDEIMLVTDRGKILRMAARDIPVVGRVAQGVKLIDVDAEEQVVSVAKVAERGDDDEGASEL